MEQLVSEAINNYINHAKQQGETVSKLEVEILRGGMWALLVVLKREGRLIW